MATREESAPAGAALAIAPTSPAPRVFGRQTARRAGPHPDRQAPLVVVAVALATGIVADRFVPIPFVAWLTVAAGGLIAWISFARRGYAVTAYVALMIAVTACGAARHHGHWRLFSNDELGRYAREQSQGVCLEVIALTGPRHRPAPLPDPLRSMAQGAHTQMRVRATAIRDGDSWRPVDGRATLLVDGTLVGVDASDRLRVVGQMQLAAPPTNPGEFDFAKHRRGDREMVTVRADFPDCVQVVEAAPWWSWRRCLHEMRAAGDRLLWGTLSHERAGLASAVLLGAREQVDDELEDDFLVTGTVHVLSISGLHVGILAFVLFKALRTGWMRRGPALLAVAILTLLYTLLTDSEPPAVRATVLVWVACGAVFLGRVPLGFNSLALAGLIVLAINPADLFRVGTQLSFLSMAALIAFGSWWAQRPRPDALTQLIHRTRPWHVRWMRWSATKVGAVALAGLVIWMVTSPLVLHRFNVVSLSALVLNTMLWIPVLFAMVSGFGVLAFGWLVPPIGAICGWVCDRSLGLIESTIDAAARLPGTYFWMPGPELGWLLGFYAVLALPLLLPRTLSYSRSMVLGAVLILAGVLASFRWPWQSSNEELVCGFVSVGHGCAVVLELPNGQVWLYDAGRLGSPRAGARSVEAYLRSRKIARIDAVILSHADIDHYNALPQLLERFSVGTVYVSGQMFRDDSAPLDVLLSAVAQAEVPFDTLSVGEQIFADDCIARVLHPPAEGVAGSDNAQSIVLAIEYAKRCVLLTGDLEPPGLQRLLGAPPLDCDLLLVPHHGSARSRPPDIVNWSTPEWAVISSGTPESQGNNLYQPLLGTRALNTADVGAVQAVLSKDRVEVRAWRVDPWN
jgi:competence protein ComEC